MIDKKYIKDLKNFWEVDSIEKAKFNRVLTTKDIRKMSLEDKEILWKKSTIKTVNRILKNVLLYEDSKVLEVGCGVGRLMKEISTKCEIIHGVDISKSMIKYSKEYLKDNPNCKTFHNNGYDLKDLEKSYYDLVYSVIVFQHIGSYEVINSYLSEIYRVLNYNGFFKFQVRKYTKGGPFTPYDNESKSGHKFAGNSYTKVQLKEILLKNGFFIEYIKHSKAQDSYWILVKK